MSWPKQGGTGVSPVRDTDYLGSNTARAVVTGIHLPVSFCLERFKSTHGQAQGPPRRTHGTQRRELVHLADDCKRLCRGDFGGGGVSQFGLAWRGFVLLVRPGACLAAPMSQELVLHGAIQQAHEDPP